MYLLELQSYLKLNVNISKCEYIVAIERIQEMKILNLKFAGKGPVKNVRLIGKLTFDMVGRNRRFRTAPGPLVKLH